MPLLKTWIRVVTNASKVCTITMVRKQTLIFGARDDGLPRRAVADPVSSVGAVTVAVTVALSVAQPVTCSHGHRDHDIMVAARPAGPRAGRGRLGIRVSLQSDYVVSYPAGPL